MSQINTIKGPQLKSSGGNGDRPRRPRREPEEEVWVPKTILGKKLHLEKFLL